MQAPGLRAPREALEAIRQLRAAPALVGELGDEQGERLWIRHEVRAEAVARRPAPDVRSTYCAGVTGIRHALLACCAQRVWHSVVNGSLHGWSCVLVPELFCCCCLPYGRSLRPRRPQ